MAAILKTGTVITVAAAGTRVQFPVVDRVVKVYLYGPSGNTGIMYVGDVTVAATNGIPVVKSVAPVTIDAPEGQVIDLTTLYVDAATSGDKIAYSYLQLTN